MVAVVVDPPRRVRINVPWYPPVVVKSAVLAEDAYDYLYAMAILIDKETGLVVEDGLNGQGQQTTRAIKVEEYPKSHNYYVFPNLSASHTGKYRIRVDIYRCNSLTNREGYVLMEQVESRSFRVGNSAVPTGVPSTREADVLDMLRSVDDDGTIPPVP